MGSSTKTIQYVYDSRGNRRALVDPDGGRFTYTYDAVNRISQVQNPQGDRTSYSYDPAGRRTVKEMANGTRASFSYDPAGNLTGLYNLKSGGTVISSFDYTYDKVGNRTSVLEADGSRVTWSYDDTYQLTGEHRTGTSPYRDTYTYDPSGNRLLKIHDGARTTYAYDAANQLTYSEDASGRTTYTFDADGNQQVVRAPSGDRTTYVWDYENRMTSAQLPSGIRNTMAYDADGLRVKLEESGGAKKFVWDDQNYLAETDENNDTQVVYTNEPRRYGNLISQRRGSTSHWYHFDAIGSTRELTNSSAVITDTRLYDAWGLEVAATGATSFSFNYLGALGYRRDHDGDLPYVRARILIPALGRWLSRDRLFIRRGQSRYVYVMNAPPSRVDPSGHQCRTCTSRMHAFPAVMTRLFPFTALFAEADEGGGRVRVLCRFQCGTPLDVEVDCAEMTAFDCCNSVRPENCDDGQLLGWETVDEIVADVPGTPDLSEVWISKEVSCALGLKCKCAFEVGASDCLRAKELADCARDASKNSGLPGQSDGEQDAFRHCLWSCLMARSIGKSQAQEIADIYEICSPNVIESTCMDLWNNAVGRSSGAKTQRFVCCETLCQGALNRGLLQTSAGCPPGSGVTGTSRTPGFAKYGRGTGNCPCNNI